MQKQTMQQFNYGKKTVGKSGQKTVSGSFDQSDSSTVITRTAVPKYGNFQSARKKPIEISTKPGGNVREVEVKLSHLNKPSGRIMGSMSPIVVGHKTNEALKARPCDETGYGKNGERTFPRRSADFTTNTHVVHPLQGNNVQQIVKPTNSSQPGVARSIKDKPISVVDPIQNGKQGTELLKAEAASADQHDQVPAGSVQPSPDSFISNSNIFLEQWTKSASEAMCLKEENKSIKTQLEVQLQVNKELKRLLVASVGEDLCQRVENLIRDKADLSAELGDFARKVSEDYENLDKISIQADMWRSKYIASRLMIDELAKWKAVYGVQYQESQRVIQEVLNERHELRSNLHEAYRCLQQVRDAFDPLNTHKSSSLQSNNVIDLAKTIQNLTDTIRFRLLPPGLAVNAPSANRAICWSDGLTKAESSAQELLSRQVDFSELEGHRSGISVPSSNLKIDRYHPQASFENLTLNCCGECKGEIKLI